LDGVNTFHFHRYYFNSTSVCLTPIITAPSRIDHPMFRLTGLRWHCYQKQLRRVIETFLGHDHLGQRSIWKISWLLQLFNNSSRCGIASLASCGKIENTHAPLLVHIFQKVLYRNKTKTCGMKLKIGEGSGFLPGRNMQPSLVLWVQKRISIIP